MNTNPTFQRSGTGLAGSRAGRVPSLPFPAIHPQRLLVILALLFVTALNAKDEISPPLRVLSESADVIVVAFIKESPFGTLGSAPIASSTAKLYYQEAMPCRIRIERVLKGIPPPTLNPLLSIRVPMVSHVQGGDNGPAFLESLRKESKWIMFLQYRDKRAELAEVALNNESCNLIAFDPWLSVLPYSKSLEVAISHEK